MGWDILPPMRGCDRSTGKALDGIDHLRQSIVDILTTPIGSRVMRRDYGSLLFQLIDQPLNKSTLVEIYAATASALGKWEPRFQVQRVIATSVLAGQVILSLTGLYLPEGKQVTLDGIVV